MFAAPSFLSGCPWIRRVAEPSYVHHNRDLHVRHRCSVKIARSLGCRLCRTAAVVVDCRATARMLFPTRRAAVVDLPGVDIATGTENACPIFAYGRLVEIVAGAAVVPASSSGLSGRP